MWAVAGGKTFRSGDGAASWERVAGPPTDVEGLDVARTGGGVRLLTFEAEAQNAPVTAVRRSDDGGRT